MRETKTKEIGGVTYAVRVFGALEGLRTMALLARTAGPLAVGEIADGLRGLNPDDVVLLASAFAKETKIRVPVNFTGATHVDQDLPLDDHFAGKPTELLQWLAFAVEANYGPFFADAKVAIQAALARSMIRTPSPSPSTSANDGPSGGSSPPEPSTPP